MKGEQDKNLENLKENDMVIRTLALAAALLVSACSGSSDDDSHTDSGSNHSDSGSNHTDSGSNHSDSESNHTDSGSNHSAPSYNEELAIEDMVKLEVQRQKWIDFGYQDYQFTYDMNCTCYPPVSFETSVVLVQDGEISEVFETVSGEYIEEYDYSRFKIQTIDDWFDYAESLIERVPDMLQITYNEEFGYPESIRYDLYVNGSDDEASYSLSELQ